jgi:NADH dehydrogenase
MPTLGRKLRIWVEWTWSMFFPTDITHLRFTRTTDTDAACPAPPLPDAAARQGMPAAQPADKAANQFL